MYVWLNQTQSGAKTQEKPPERPPANRKEACKRHVVNCVQHGCLLVLLLVYAFIGAGVFYALEHQKQEEDLKLLRDTARNRRLNFTDSWMETFRKNPSCGHVDAFYHGTKTIYELDQEARARYHRAWSTCRETLRGMLADYEHKLGFSEDFKYKWDFWSAMFYAATVFTTIGYGHMYCKTDFGKVVTMLYAFIGIPLMLTVIHDLVKVINGYMFKLYLLLRRSWRRLTRRRARYNRGESVSSTDISPEHADEDNPTQIPVLVALTFLVLYIVICAAIFRIWETQWDYFTAFYFFFVSLTTIGLGDIVPTRPDFTVFGFGFVIIGLAMVSMSVGAVQTNVRGAYDRALDNFKVGLGLDAPDQPLGNNVSLLRRISRSIVGKQNVNIRENGYLTGSATLGVLQVTEPASRLEEAVQTDDSFLRYARMFAHTESEEGLNMDQFSKSMSKDSRDFSGLMPHSVSLRSYPTPLSIENTSLDRSSNIVNKSITTE